MKRAWDNYSAYLFDIDGTLLHCHDAVHYFGFCSVLTHAVGRNLNLDGVQAHGNTDAGIMRDALLLAGHSEELWRPRLSMMQEELCRYVDQHASELEVEALPGVKSLLAHLRGRGARIGVATGNLERIGWHKLRAAGLAGAFDFCGFSDAHEYRADVFHAALHIALQKAPCTKDAVCVIGDTPADIQAARANSLDVIAVATGAYSHEVLQQARPDLLLHSLEDLLIGP